MARADFIDEIRSKFPDAIDHGDGRVVFDYTVTTGIYTGKKLAIGYEVPVDFPMVPPPGPHVSEQIWPIKSGGEHPSGGIHKSPFGPNWQYWSRPIKNWKETDRSAKTVLAHLNFLFDTQG